MTEANPQRLLIQYLEPSPATATADPARLSDHLAFALGRLPVTDLALGWELRAEVVEALRRVIPAEVAVWRWVPVFTDPGTGVLDEHFAVGPDGQAPPPFQGLADFRFLCLDQAEAIEVGLERAVRLGREIDADGVLLDRIRWHSPSASPARELTCFCEHSRAAAADDGIDLSAISRWAQDAALTLDGRRTLVSVLLGGAGPEPVTRFLDWRDDTVTRAVGSVSQGLATAGFRTALDVFTPALARSVGQDLNTIGKLGEWSKSMTYFEAKGPAAMPFELSGHAKWLSDAGDPDPAAFIADVLGFAAPGIGATEAQIGTLKHESSALAAAVGVERAVVGIDAVGIPGVCEVDDDDLGARLRALRTTGFGASPCWDLLLIDNDRIERMSAAWAGGTDARE